MRRLQGRPVHVAGGGILGLATAHELAKAGARVTVFDPRHEGPSASAVAAGMLAPVFEACLDPVSRPHFDLFLAARDLWPDFALETGIILHRRGARYRGVAGEVAEVAARLESLGVAPERQGDQVYTAEDWRIEPSQAIAVLRQALDRAGVVTRQYRLDRPHPGVQTVVATGWSSLEWAPETRRLTAIKGHILTLKNVRGEGAVERTAGGYLCPSSEGLRLGATMEVGRTDLNPDPVIAGALLDRLAPSEAGTGREAPVVQVGIRAATTDGLPMVGPSTRSGVWLAVGARRNGWLLAPLVGRMTAAYLAGEDPGPWSQALQPGRFEGSRGE